MACDQSQLLSLYADGELAAPRRAAMVEHLAVCPKCAAELDELQALRRLMSAARNAPWTTTPDGVAVDDVMARLQAHVQDLVESTDYALLRLARIFSGVAACVLIGGLWLMNQPASTTAPQQARVGWDDVATRYVIDTPHAAVEAADRGATGTIEQTVAEPTTRERALDALFGDVGGTAAAAGLAGRGSGERGSAEVELP